MNDLIVQLLGWLKSGRGAALSTLVWREGSSPRPVGSKMAVSSKEDVIGSVSGGCVEGALIDASFKAMQDGNSQLIHYGITDDMAWEVGLSCGGQIKVQVLPVLGPSYKSLSTQAVEIMADMMAARQQFFTISGFLGEPNQSFFIINNQEVIYPIDVPKWYNDRLFTIGKTFLKNESPGIVAIPKGEIFFDVYIPEPRLFIIGAVHIAATLARLAKILGYFTVVIDPRAIFATRERFPDADELLVQWPVESMESQNFGDTDFLVLLSHDDKLDLPALETALEKKPRYIGMLSSRKNRDERFNKLEEAGCQKSLLEQVHTPVGLDLGGPSPEEIALSILAEMTAHRYGKCE